MRSGTNLFGITPPVARPLLVLILTCFLAASPSCRNSREETAGGILTVAGSTSVQPFAEKLAEEFSHRRPDLSINVQGGGSTAGVRAAQAGVAQIGMSSRSLKPGEENLVKTTIVHDGIAVIVHQTNPVSDLDLERIAEIFSGEATRWDDLGEGRGEIHFVTREEGSGTRGAFENLVMGKKLISPRGLVQDSNGAVREIIASDPGAIGYISLGIVDFRVKALAVDGVSPSKEAIASGSYPLVRPFLFLTKGAPYGVAKEFIDFVLSDEGQNLLAEEGLITIEK